MQINPDVSLGKVTARVAAGVALTMAAGRASASLDKLATWFLAAFGAGLALTFSHLKEVSAFVPASCLVSAVYLFIFASILCLVQRYVATVVGCGASGVKDGRELGEKLAHMDLEEFIAQLKVGIPRLFRPLSSGLLDAIAKGDFTVVGRLLIRLALVQGLLAMGEIILLLFALSRIANEISA